MLHVKLVHQGLAHIDEALIRYAIGDKVLHIGCGKLGEWVTQQADACH